MNIQSSAPDYVRAIAPYQAGKPIAELAREYGLDEHSIVKLASNENPLGMSPKAQHAMMMACADIGRYPDANGFVLKSALAQRHGIPADWITLGNGSNDILELCAHVFLSAATSCVFSQYAFIVYGLVTQATGARAIVVPALDHGHDLDCMYAAIEPDTRLIFLANPNNPTGTFLSGPAIEDFLLKVPADVVVVLDEAYNEYLPLALQYDAIGLTRRFPNLLVSRSFSKAYGLAGLRVGYGIAQPELSDLLNRIRQPFNVNSLAQAAAAAALFDDEFLQKTYDLNRQGLARLEAGFRHINLSFIESSANFLLVNVGNDPLAGMRVYTELLKHSVIVRPVVNYGLPQWLRISVGLPKENELLLKALTNVLADNSTTGATSFASGCVKVVNISNDGMGEHGVFFKRLVIIGTGLMGGSLALAVKAQGMAAHIVGYSRRLATAKQAQHLGIVDEAADNLPQAVRGADAIYIAVPVAQFTAICGGIAPLIQALRSDDDLPVIFDAGSTKQSIAQTVAALAADYPLFAQQFVLCHPIAGAEKSGPLAADSQLYTAKTVVMCPGIYTSLPAYDNVKALWLALGVHLKEMPVSVHDDMFAAVSHLPHWLAYAYVSSQLSHALGKEFMLQGGAGFKDFTRIAASSPEMWIDIFRANRSHLLQHLDRFEASLGKMRYFLESGKDSELLELLTRVSVFRENFLLSPEEMNDIAAAGWAGKK